jgi:hypothetical protein
LARVDRRAGGLSLQKVNRKIGLLSYFKITHSGIWLNIDLLDQRRIVAVGARAVDALADKVTCEDTLTRSIRRGSGHGMLERWFG